MASSNPANPDSAIPVYIASGNGHGSGWYATAGASPLTTTTAASVKSAVADRRHYVSGIQLSNSNATASVVQLLDGATIIWAGYLHGTGGTESNINVALASPIPCAENSALTIKALSSGASIYWNVQGYTAE